MMIDLKQRIVNSVTVKKIPKQDPVRYILYAIYGAAIECEMEAKKEQSLVEAKYYSELKELMNTCLVKLPRV